MQLNVINTSSLIALAASTGACGAINTRFGNVAQLNDDVFKYVVTGNRKDVLLINRIDLMELFKDIPQDISDLTYTPNSPDPLTDLGDKFGLDSALQEPPLFPGDSLDMTNEDELNKAFALWQAFAGIPALPRRDVELSSIGNVMYIDARHAVAFRGILSVTYKKDTVNE